jgi:Rha family phage regulatory protein
MSDYNNRISKEEMIGKFALSSKNGLTQDDVELAGMLADFHNKAYDGGYRVGQEEARKELVQISQDAPVQQEQEVVGVSFYDCNGQKMVSSRDVAKNFEKEHKDVLRAVENIKAQNCALTSMFFESTYTAGTGKAYPMYLMNRDGFSLLAMGFTGSKAMEWKLKYIQAFNAMERKLTTPESDDMILSRAILIANKKVEQLQSTNIQLVQENVKLKPASDYAHAVLMSDEKLTVKQIAQNYGMTSQKFNSILEEMGIQYKVNKQWILYRKYQGKGYVVGIPFDIGNGKTKERTYWTRKGQAFLYKKLKEAGHEPINEQLSLIAVGE